MKVSVVIPAHNEEKYIGKCLESIANQTVLADEIIVVNNNCTDKTEEVARKFGARIVYEKKQGITPARNRGFNSARYEIIARCDADAVVPKDWIKKIKGNFKKGKVDAFSGPVFFDDSQLFKSTFTLPSRTYLGLLKLMSKGKRHLLGPNMTLTKNIWNKVKDIVNLDDKKVHEDMDLSLKIAKVNGKIGFDPTLVVGISARRLKRNPASFFLVYPTLIFKTFLANKK